MALISRAVEDRLRRSFERINRWGERLPAEQQRLLRRADSRRELARRSYIDSYWRVRETSPLILAAIHTFNVRQDFYSARFWGQHFAEELGHDAVQYRDIVNIYGSQRKTSAVLAERGISPPSAAILAYFHWQVTQGDPHLLMVYRLFLELFMVEMPAHTEFFRNMLGKSATRTVTLHREADAKHVKGCRRYIDRSFRAEHLRTLLWTVDFICDRLIESQLWILDGIHVEAQP